MSLTASTTGTSQGIRRSGRKATVTPSALAAVNHAQEKGLARGQASSKRRDATRDMQAR